MNGSVLSVRAVCLMLAFAMSCILASAVALPVFGQESERGASVTMVGAGDIALCNSDGDSQTARLVAQTRGTVFTLGDNVQVNGTAQEYRDCYDPTWGRFKDRTRPSVGNHDYYTAGARPYYSYFGSAAGPAGRGYYAYRSGPALIVVLNSNCGDVGCGPDSPQIAWLRTTLKKNQTRCTVAMFHHPLFSTNAPSPEVSTFWNVLYKNDADLILNGHAHSYERFKPQMPNGAVDQSRGIREIVVGTGGTKPVDPFGPRPRNSVVRNDDTFGVLKLTLGRTSYNWKFLPVAGKTFTDSGTSRCH